MDNVTHALIGAGLGQAGLKRVSGLGMAALIIGANIPDLDAGCSMYGLESLAMRRGLSHGPIALLLLPAVLTAGLVAFDRWQQRRGTRPADRATVRPRWLFLLALIGTLSHPLFDWMNTYGIRLLEPFSSRWFYGDSLFIVDPWIWLMLGLGIWRSRKRERAAHARWRTPALLGCAAVALYTVVNMGITARAERAAADLLAVDAVRDAGPLLVVASPVPFKFWERRIAWRGAVRFGFGHSSLFGATQLDAGSAPLGLDHPGLAELRQRSADARAFMFWARMPVVTERDGAAYLGD
ncbi:MAG: metal-dependent hydrolase [Myxococcales bacterium]|nr:metal-dependent hydrolase [Myxococcales bacterium]